MPLGEIARRDLRGTADFIVVDDREVGLFSSDQEGPVASAPQPRRIRGGDGKSYQLGRITLTFKIAAQDCGAAYTLCEAIEPPGSGAGLHRHGSYDETHIVC